MFRKLKLIALILSLILPLGSYAIQTAFYNLRDDNLRGYQDLKQIEATINNNHQYINMIISQAYQIDENGMLWGDVNHNLKKLAEKYKIKFVPLITNQDFSSKKLTAFLQSASAQKRMINAVLTACKENNFPGIQLDFESLHADQRDNFTFFYNNLAKKLNANGYFVSLTIFPIAYAVPPSSLLKDMQEHNAVAYDLPKLAKLSNFISVMTYNQHDGPTTPGPMAGYPWVEQVIKYMLQFVPAEKLSLGIPSYSGYWSMQTSGKRHYAYGNEISYEDVLYLKKIYKQSWSWDSTQKVYYSIFNINNLNQYLFIESGRSFAAKMELVKKYKLKGISVWRLGMEDPAIWDVLKKQQ